MRYCSTLFLCLLAVPAWGTPFDLIVPREIVVDSDTLHPNFGSGDERTQWMFSLTGMVVATEQPITLDRFGAWSEMSDTSGVTAAGGVGDGATILPGQAALYGWPHGGGLDKDLYNGAIAAFGPYVEPNESVITTESIPFFFNLKIFFPEDFSGDVHLSNRLYLNPLQQDRAFFDILIHFVPVGGVPRDTLPTILSAQRVSSVTVPEPVTGLLLAIGFGATAWRAAARPRRP